MRDPRALKAALRSELLRVRRGLSADARDLAGTALESRVRDLPELARAHTVAAYVSMGSEPGTHGLIESLRVAGRRVLLPVLLPDNDLDWARYDGPDALRRTERGLLEPTGDRLGPQAVTEAEALLLPGLAVDRSGVRLGRGGGSYDRVLARLEAAGKSPALVVLLYANEVVESVPREAHDHLVDAVITPVGVHHFAR
ncbi:5-formyltetrahydrofolate cyclo-ligase [Actinacidiphila rubida]|uniref:5-formyltetrahydrofolate cyclo-ligase n=1 Tax=Actinacidiphila rubida TaxID=310780 RepID=A0A1H8DQJ4_9ACTN|nr:5-formyltetrahydrofolate cyclo-ligase [Actinacidiphila rubida]SEN09601.1 5-formyltetrahydrofolate cyclo-ligase [Actinacidiphila rubida]